MKKKIIMLVLACLFILDFVLVSTSKVSFFDDAVYRAVISLKSDFFTVFFKGITFLASTEFIIILNIFIIIYMVVKKKFGLSIIVISSLSSSLINNLVKFLVKRDRPLDIALIKETFYSFPSGHAMISLLFYGSIIYLLNQYKPKNYKILSFVIGIFILLVGISRIYLGVHFASDIIGGYLLSGIILITLASITKKYIKG